MVDILVRNVDDVTAAQLKKKAKAAGTSVNEVARAALTAYVKPDKTEAWARVDAIRKKIGRVSGDSTQIIREWRDNKARYR